VLDGMAAHPDDNSKAEREVRAQVLQLCRRFPVYTGRR
jgi:glycine hydroxymethyltransferase